MERPMCQDSSVSLHYVDDDAETLLHIAKQPHLQRWKLYFADWCGYHIAAHHIRLKRSCSLLP